MKTLNKIVLFGLFMFLTGIVHAQEAVEENIVEQTATETIEHTQAPEPAEIIEEQEQNIPYIEDIGNLRSFVDGVVEAHMKADKIAGVTVAIVQNNELLYSNGYGVAKISEFRPVSAQDTLFRLASISKTFTWTAIMQLAEAGKLNIDDPIDDHLPPSLQMYDDNFDNPILIRHLMSHNLGLEDAAMGHLFVRDEGKLTGMREYLANHRPEQVREAGVSTSYSNYATALAGVIVEEVSGQPFNEYIEEHILTPLDMTNTSFREPYTAKPGLPEPISAELAANISSGFIVANGIVKEKPFEYINHVAPAGGISSTAHDISRYMMAHLNQGSLKGRDILATETANTMQQTLFSNAESINGFAHGFMQYNLPGGYKAYGHGGATLYFMSNMVIVPELDLGIFISTNTSTGGKLAYEFQNILVNHFFVESTARERQKPADGFAQRGERFVGTYLSDRHSYGQLEKFISIFKDFTKVSISPEGYLVTTNAAGSKSWVETGDLTFTQTDGHQTIAFSQDEDGNIVKMFTYLGIAAATKVGFFRSADWFQIIFTLTLIASIGSLSGSWLRRNKHIHESLNESVASRLSAFMGFIWVLFFGFFIAALVQLTSMQQDAIFNFPPSNLVIALWIALIGLLLSLINLPSLFVVWRDGHWPVWRRIRHSLVVIFSFAFVLTLYHWNLLGFHYF